MQAVTLSIRWGLAFMYGPYLACLMQGNNVVENGWMVYGNSHCGGYKSWLREHVMQMDRQTITL